jgi:hypothetical protein
LKDSHSPVLPLPVFVPRRYKPGGRGAWSAHLAFANDLVSAIRPSLIVELGTHYGESYFTFCQSVLENRLACLCYAVDNWFGDEHAGFYGQEVLDDVERYNDTHYRHFSYLLRATFDEAVLQFADGSIDLLHIDGLHTYEAANHDFRTWLPKVKSGGIILLHDIAVRKETFGIWKLWGDLTAEFGETFAFHHGWGLGVLRKPGSSAERGALLDLLFDSGPEIQNCIRRNYAIYAAYLDSMLGANAQ